MVYGFEITVNVSKLLPEVGMITDELNRMMAEFGFNEKMVIRSSMHLIKMSVSRALSCAEQEAVRQQIESSAREKLGEYDIRVIPAKLIEQ